MRLPAVQLLAQFGGVDGLQFRVSLRQSDQVQFVFLAFAKPPTRIAVGPKLPLRHIFAASDPHPNPQDRGLHRSVQESLVPFVRSELNAKLALESLDRKLPRQFRKVSGNNHNIRVERIDGLNIAVDCQTADQTVWPEGLARGDRAREIAS